MESIRFKAQLGKVVAAGAMLAALAFSSTAPVQAQSIAAEAAALANPAPLACAAPLEAVSARIKTTSPSLTVLVKNTDPLCSAEVTLAIWNILNRASFTVADVVSLRQMVDDGNLAGALAIINEVVTKSQQALQTSEVFTVDANSEKLLTLRYPTACNDVQVDAYYGNGITADVLDAGIRGPRPDCKTEGCTPGYWKNHLDSWQGYTSGQTLESVFDVPDSLGMDNNTLLQALDFGGGPGVTGGAQILFRAAAAALLNAEHSGVNYPLTTAQVISQVNAALATNNRDAMLTLATDLDIKNNLGCPLN